MANMIYLSVNGNQQGTISQGCCSLDSIGNKYQLGHENEIFVLHLNNMFNRAQNLAFSPVNFVKLLDKSTPLLANAIANNEVMEMVFSFYRTSQNGSQEKYFSVTLRQASIVSINSNYPHSADNNDAQPEETISVKYKDIIFQHVMAGTSGYCCWEESTC
ncbi:Hcp family type VI secretion system effector [Morganella morganii]|uniref:Hcp family type VI secretion system effector n=1 Tax=Morganella morganii TaxID=582 RepID=A0AAE4JQU6_MORMO|nr:Hcp family type VI secretion system effector [Morganella morganii]EGT3608944.1 Hcp family type VI secretion system effector [Morganella morganii]EJG2204059.1 Hcp family type VI secretion system effector [Morganella morganii]ELN8406057.1 Hcp family type VI secretion system effector [Morganella morganii]MBC4002408.1 Hcp family type VI secretion system effector [Morganella morganii]MBT0400680.1 Hcp family type VI secretion system effector [Morganella morganii subsp. morganii]